MPTFKCKGSGRSTLNMIILCVVHVLTNLLLLVCLYMYTHIGKSVHYTTTCGTPRTVVPRYLKSKVTILSLYNLYLLFYHIQPRTSNVCTCRSQYMINDNNRVQRSRRQRGLLSLFQSRKDSVKQKPYTLLQQVALGSSMLQVIFTHRTAWCHCLPSFVERYTLQVLGTVFCRTYL